MAFEEPGFRELKRCLATCKRVDEFQLYFAVFFADLASNGTTALLNNVIGRNYKKDNICRSDSRD